MFCWCEWGISKNVQRWQKQRKDFHVTHTILKQSLCSKRNLLLSPFRLVVTFINNPPAELSMELWGNYIAYQLFYLSNLFELVQYSVILYSNYSFFKQCPLLLKQHNALERPTSRELAQDNFNNNSGRSKIFVDLFSYLVVRRLFFTFGPTKEYNTSESCVGSDQMPSGC